MLLAGCAEPEPVAIELGTLVLFETRFDGQVIEATGTLRTHDAPRHYWIEDAELNRVALVVDDDLAPRVGERLTVAGTFRFDRTAGRRIEVSGLSPAPSAGAGME